MVGATISCQDDPASEQEHAHMGIPHVQAHALALTRVRLAEVWEYVHVRV
jgi:hypothetical protein